MTQQHCCVCGNEFIINLEVVSAGRLSGDNACTKCISKEKTRLTEFLSFPAVMNDGNGFRQAEPLISEKGYKLPIQIWKFEGAPKLYQEMSDAGGDEDWIALIPPNLFDYGLPFWMESMDSLHRPQIYDIALGYKVVIASH